jgi:hypothetical protein
MSFYAPYDEAPDAYDELFREIGETVTEWSRLENALLDLFQVLTAMPHRLARRIFFSARSFNGRADLLRAAAAATEAKPEFVNFTRAVITRALQYSAFRNALAHGSPIVVPPIDCPYDNQAVIVEERDFWNPHSEKPTTITDIKTARANMISLHHISYIAAAWNGDDVGTSPERCAELVRQLPNPPQSKATDPSFAEEMQRLLLRQMALDPKTRALMPDAMIPQDLRDL